MVEDDSAVGPAVMVDQAQIGEKTYTDSLQASLIAQCEGVTLDLYKDTWRVEEQDGKWVWETNNLGLFLG